jgi:hypothetical protein
MRPLRLNRVLLFKVLHLFRPGKIILFNSCRESSYTFCIDSISIKTAAQSKRDEIFSLFYPYCLHQSILQIISYEIRDHNYIYPPLELPITY